MLGLIDICGIVLGFEAAFEDGAAVVDDAVEVASALEEPATTVVLGLMEICGMVFGSEGAFDDGAAVAEDIVEAVSASDEGTAVLEAAAEEPATTVVLGLMDIWGIVFGSEGTFDDTEVVGAIVAEDEVVDTRGVTVITIVVVDEVTSPTSPSGVGATVTKSVVVVVVSVEAASS